MMVKWKIFKINFYYIWWITKKKKTFKKFSTGKWTCDLILCPNSTYECYVSKTNEKNASVVVRTDICYSQYYMPLLSNVTSSPVNPTEMIRIEIKSFRNGNLIINNSGNVFNSKKFKKQLKKELQGMDSNLSNEMKHLQESLGNMENGLQHMFNWSPYNTSIWQQFRNKNDKILKLILHFRKNWRLFHYSHPF